MSFPTDMLRQVATYWKPAAAPYDSYGDSSFIAPVILHPRDNKGVRWENKSIKFVRPNGDEDVSRALVWSSTTQFVVGGYLYLGASTATDPETVTGAFQILTVGFVPSVKGLNPIWKAVL